MIPATPAATFPAQASRPDFIRGDTVTLPDSFQLRRPGVKTGTVERLRKNVIGKWRAYVIVNGVRWVFPVAQLKKIASGK
jgi:hypothetical protein